MQNLLKILKKKRTLIASSFFQTLNQFSYLTHHSYSKYKHDLKNKRFFRRCCIVVVAVVVTTAAAATTTFADVDVIVAAAAIGYIHGILFSR